MRVFTNKTFTGHWPVGTAAVVVAEGPIEAADLLAAALTEHGLPLTVISPDDMQEIYADRPSVRVLCDGNY